jgi:peptide/nickel transport system permease protein
MRCSTRGFVMTGLEPPAPAAEGLGTIDTADRMRLAARQRSGTVAFLRRFAANRLALGGLGLFAAILLFCFVGPLLYHTDQVHTNILAETLRPSSKHPFGTDDVGYDELGRLMVGGQTSLEIGLGAAAVAVGFGVLWGTVSGYFGGILDAVMMRVVDGILAIPVLFFLILVATMVRPSVPLLVGVLGALAWLIPARLVRGESLSLKRRDFVQAVRVMGGHAPRIIGRHLIPNTVGTILVNATFQVADAVLALAALSFLGLGIPPPAANWGGMLSEGLNYTFSDYWWLIYPPGIALILTVLAINLVGDGLRDAVLASSKSRG